MESTRTRLGLGRLGLRRLAGLGWGWLGWAGGMARLRMADWGMAWLRLEPRVWLQRPSRRIQLRRLQPLRLPALVHFAQPDDLHQSLPLVHAAGSWSEHL